MRNLLTIISLLFFVQVGHTQRILIINGTAHIGNGEVIETAAIGISNGKILFVKNALTNAVQRKEWDTIIDAENQHV